MGRAAAGGSCQHKSLNPFNLTGKWKVNYVRNARKERAVFELSGAQRRKASAQRIQV
jgi:hypothetical protein